MKRLLALLMLMPALAWAMGYDAYDREVLSDSPVAYWRLNDPSIDTTTAVDASGNGHNGTYGGTGGTLVKRIAPARSTCPYSVVNDSSGGGAADQQIVVPDDAAFDRGTGNFTLEFFWKQANLNSNSGCSTNGTLISKGTANGGFPYVFCQWTGVVELDVQMGADTSSILSANDTWRMITLARTSTTNVKKYINGSFSADFTIDAAVSLTNAADFMLYYNGTIGGGATTTFTQGLDNVSFYATALDATAIGDHWTAATSYHCMVPDPYEVRNDRPSLFGLIRPVSLPQ